MDTTRKVMRQVMLGEVFGKPITFAWVHHPEGTVPPTEILFRDRHGRDWEGATFTVRSLKEFRQKLLDELIEYRRHHPTESLVIVFQELDGSWKPLGTGIMPGDEKDIVSRAPSWYERASEAHKEEYKDPEDEEDELATGIEKLSDRAATIMAKVLEMLDDLPKADWEEPEEDEADEGDYIVSTNGIPVAILSPHEGSRLRGSGVKVEPYPGTFKEKEYAHLPQKKRPIWVMQTSRPEGAVEYIERLIELVNPDPRLVDTRGPSVWGVKGYDIDWEEAKDEGYDPDDPDVIEALAEGGWFEQIPDTELKIWLGEFDKAWYYAIISDRGEYEEDGPYGTEDEALRKGIDVAREKGEEEGLVPY
jgi:hypothetical protein